MWPSCKGNSEMMSHFSNQRGMTLLEVLVAATVVCVGLLAVAVMFPTSSTNIDYGGKTSKATAIAQEKLEELRNTSFASMVAGSDTPTGYSRSWTLSDAGGSPFRLRTLSVTVSWPSATGRPNSVTLQTLFAEY